MLRVQIVLLSLQMFYTNMAFPSTHSCSSILPKVHKCLKLTLSRKLLVSYMLKLTKLTDVLVHSTLKRNYRLNIELSLFCFSVWMRVLCWSEIIRHTNAHILWCSWNYLVPLCHWLWWYVIFIISTHSHRFTRNCIFSSKLSPYCKHAYYYEPISIWNSASCKS